MRTIKDGDTNVHRILGKARVKTDGTRYRLLRYVLRTECPEGTLLHNVMTGRLILLEADEVDILQSLPTCVGQNSEDAFSEEQLIKALIESHFLVPVDYNEKTSTDTLRMLIDRALAPKGIKSYTILTTTDCNARCFYCYQAGRQHIGMSAQTATKLVDYMAEHKTEDALSLHWFGGEPLVGIARIRQICSALRNRDVEYKSSMTSNGYLLTEDVVKEAVEDWHLKKVQITIDGTEDIYNRTKAYHGVGAANKSPYKRVLANIKTLADHQVRVHIRLNLDQHNFDDMELLVDELGSRFGGNSYIQAYVHVLFENEGFDPVVRDEATKEMLYKRQLEIESIIRAVDLSRPPRSLPSLKVHGCMADSPSTIVVYPDGRFFKCQHTGDGDAYGSLEQGTTCQQNIDKFKERVLSSECDKCPRYPACYMLRECPGDSKESCNSPMCRRLIDKDLQAMQNVYAEKQQDSQ